MIHKKIKSGVLVNDLSLIMERSCTVAGIGLIEGMNISSSIQFSLQCLVVSTILWICGNNVSIVVTLN